jgi:hypothetical protein
VPRKSDTEHASGRLIELLTNASDADLSAITERIGQVERELEDTTKRLRGELDGLRLLKKSIEWRLHGKPQRKVPSGPSKKKKGEVATGMYDLIAAEGSLPPKVIAQRLGIKPATAGVVAATCEWFKRLPSGDVDIAMTRDN